MFKIISKETYQKLRVDSQLLDLVLDKLREQEEADGTTPRYHCGYKTCQFSTTDPQGLKIHRGRMHSNK